MTALEGNGVDLPDIALVAERIDVCVLDLAMFARAVDGLRLRLTGNGLLSNDVLFDESSLFGLF